MSILLPEFFKRLDDRPDQLFYAESREVVHLDERAAHDVERIYADILPGGDVLDLMSGCRSHLPGTTTKVAGMGLDLSAMLENPQITDPILQDLNRCACLPFQAECFSGAVCTTGVQYMTRPDELFPEVARVLHPGAPFIVTFSERMYPTKTVFAWRAADEAARLRLVACYFAQSPQFGPVSVRSYREKSGAVHAVWAYKQSRARAHLN